MFEVYGIRPVVRPGISNITFYVMSSNDEAGRSAGQYWTSVEKWPTPRMTNYYLHSDGSLSTSLPADSSSSTTYSVDPNNPVLTVGGNNLPPDIGGSIPCGPMDQSTVDQRDDVLLFQTPVLDQELVLTGPLLATLFVESDAVDTDFMVYILHLPPPLPQPYILMSLMICLRRSRSLMCIPQEKLFSFRIMLCVCAGERAAWSLCT
jgi:putative CocE/NonD family hydrolase